MCHAADDKEVTEIVVTGQHDAAEWFRAESPHFIVYSDTKQQDAAKLLDKLERLDYLLHLYTQTESKAETTPKLTLYYLKKVDDIKEIDANQPAYAIGLYNSCEAGVNAFGAHMYYRSQEKGTLEKQPENEGLAYLFEAYTRHFIYRYTDLRSPNWYIDGFAQYFAGTRFSDTETVVGMAPESIRDYLSFIADHKRSLDYQDILLDKDADNHNYAGAAGTKLEFQARAWLLTHYMLSSSENIEHFRQYLTQINQGADRTQAFEKSFGFKVSKLSYVLWKYKHEPAQALKINFANGGTNDITFTSLPKSANNLILADAALRSCPSAKKGKALLAAVEKEAKKYPSSDFAQIVLSRAQIDWGNPQDAIQYLSTKTQTEKNNADAFYLLGKAKYRLALQNQGAERTTLFDAAQSHLLRACGLNSQSAEAYYSYFKAGVNAHESPSEQVLGSAIVAWRLAKEVSRFSQMAALTYAYTGKINEAQQLLKVLTLNSRDPSTVEWANLWQTKITAGVSKSELLSEMRTESAPNTNFKEWTVANNEVMKAVTLAFGLENAQSAIGEQQKQSQQMPAQGLNNKPR